MDNGQEVPDTISTATGLGTVVFDSAAVTASYNITVSGLDFGEVLGLPDQTSDPSDDVHGIHVHNADRGVNGGVVFGQREPTQDTDDFDAVVNSDGSTTFSGVWETTDPANSSISNFAAALDAATLGSDAALYWNIHTEEFPGGEIRGQWVCIATDNSETVDGTEGDDILPGLGGDDTVLGREGDDSIDGGTGDDLTRGIFGEDSVIGGDGDDIVFGGFQSDSTSGDGGDDFLGIVFGANTLTFDDGDGDDGVVGYTPGVDQFDLTAVSGLSDFDDLDLTRTFGGVEVDYGSGSFFLWNTTLRSIEEDDFLV
jgi:Ca2+-binding RTX toxin-like protein